MIEKTGVTIRAPEQVPQTRDSTNALRPPVNVFEDAEGITLEADMPGVSKDLLHLQADRDSLLIEGDVHFDMPEGMEALSMPMSARPATAAASH